MIALDADLLVRCLTLDDPGQVPAAKALLAHGEGVFVAKTVLLELEWVLRAAYKLSRPAIHGAMGKLLGLPSLIVEGPSQVSLGLAAFSRGLGFADALHLSSSADDAGFFCVRWGVCHPCHGSGPQGMHGRRSAQQVRKIAGRRDELIAAPPVAQRPYRHERYGKASLDNVLPE